MPTVVLIVAGEPNANRDVYTEDCLRKMADENTHLRFDNGRLLLDVTDERVEEMKGGVKLFQTGSIHIPTPIDWKKCGDECERCGARDGEFVVNRLVKDLVKVKLSLCTAATAYHWDGTGENPNRPITFCQFCAEEYYERWDGMWKEYYSSQGYY